MDKQCKILARVTGKDMFGNIFYRGIYLGGEHAAFQFITTTINANGIDTDYSIYRLWCSELYSTTPDMLGFTGKLIFPR